MSLVVRGLGPGPLIPTQGLGPLQVTILVDFIGPGVICPSIQILCFMAATHMVLSQLDASEQINCSLGLTELLSSDLMNLSEISSTNFVMSEAPTATMTLTEGPADVC